MGSARGNWDPREGQQPFRPNPNGAGDRTTTLRRLLIDAKLAWSLNNSIFSHVRYILIMRGKAVRWEASLSYLLLFFFPNKKCSNSIKILAALSLCLCLFSAITAYIFLSMGRIQSLSCSAFGRLIGNNFFAHLCSTWYSLHLRVETVDRLLFHKFKKC